MKETVGAGETLGVNLEVKVQEVDAKKLLFSIGASGGPPAGSLLPKLTGKGFWYRLQQRQKLEAISTASIVYMTNIFFDQTG